jgi:Ca2+-transporting ATPase
VKQTIARLRGAGLRTIMVTGDQRLTAETIGRELGLLASHDHVMDGREFRELTGEELRARLSRIGAFSRVAPQDKLAIVGALQADGEIVAMLGDGVNDAPALKKADVGVAMGLRGTDVAKEAAAIVLQDDRFETVAAAVEEGRVIYDNIQKFVFYLFSCNLAEILVLLIAALAGLPPPLLPLQILWVNIVTDTFPALALAMEPGDPDVMRRPPRNPRDAILSRSFLSSIALYGGLITVTTLLAYLWALQRSPAQATTIAFTALALAEVFHLGNARSREAVLRPSRAAANPYAIAAVVASVGLQILAVRVPFLRDVLRLADLSASQWAVTVIAAAIPALVGQAIKLARSVRASRPR